MGKLKLSSKRLRRALLTLAVISCILILTFISTTPKVTDGLSFSKAVYDHDGQLLRLTLSGDEKYRLWVPIESISPNYIRATLLLEDQYFYYHPGFNPLALVRATLHHFFGKTRGGASTITMQLARIRYGMKTRTPLGKLKQIFTALALELRHSKQEILEAYLNLAPFGGPIEGIEAASLIYFKRHAMELSLTEALQLVVTPQMPQHRQMQHSLDTTSPVYQAKVAVVKKWLRNVPKDNWREKDLLLPLRTYNTLDLPFHAPHFTQWVLSQTDANHIHTTLQLPRQKQIEQKFKRYISRLEEVGITNGSALLIDHEKQEVISYVGSKDFFDDSISGQIDGLQSARSPGSTLKPFVYALAIEQGLIHQKTLLKDRPTHFASYTPENHDRRFLGPLTSERALNKSRNVPAVFLNQKLQNPDLYDFLKKAHIHFPHDKDYYGLTLALGGTEITPWNLAHLYSALANHGAWRPLIWQKTNQELPETPLLNAESSFMTLSMLTQNTRSEMGLQQKWSSFPYPVAWKTGTSHGFRDAWSVAIVGPYTLVVWLGHFDNHSTPTLMGRKVAAPLLFEIIDGLVEKDFQQPQWLTKWDYNIKKVSVCQVSGRLPGKHCPHKEMAWFIPGVSPIHTCDIHRPVVVSKTTGLRSCQKPGPNDEIKVFEFWPSDTLELFAQAGLQRRLPPESPNNCPKVGGISRGKAPEIIHPPKRVHIIKSLLSSSNSNQLVLKASADTDVKRIHWFLNNQFLGSSQPKDPLVIQHQLAGQHTLTVIDDQGRADQMPLKITVAR